MSNSLNLVLIAFFKFRDWLSFRTLLKTNLKPIIVGMDSNSLNCSFRDDMRDLVFVFVMWKAARWNRNSFCLCDVVDRKMFFNSLEKTWAK